MDWIHRHPEVEHFHDAYIAAREGARNALNRVFCGEITREDYFGLMERVAAANEAYLAAWKRVSDSRDQVDLALTSRAS